MITGTETVTEMENWDTGAYIDVEVPTGEFQTCGPFEEWTAAPATARPEGGPA
ncbi:hypothetical protein ABZ671_00635 [Micromonospora sp. NPDC006766]|uniref:hypothetical protein n=1 Tax=Micromonospora sp. NPDC006766 TaxID=3154778 RepID=UPI0033D9FCC5